MRVCVSHSYDIYTTIKWKRFRQLGFTQITDRLWTTTMNGFKR